MTSRRGADAASSRHQKPQAGSRATSAKGGPGADRTQGRSDSPGVMSFGSYGGVTFSSITPEVPLGTWQAEQTKRGATAGLLFPPLSSPVLPCQHAHDTVMGAGHKQNVPCDYTSIYNKLE